MATSSAPREILLIEGPQGPVGRLAGQPGLEGWVLTRIERLASADRLLQGRTFQALILDLHLPDTDGLDALRRVRALSAGLPVVALAEARAAGLAEAAVAEGAQACLPRESLTAVGLDWALKQALQRSAAEARRFRALFDSSPIGILLASGRRVAMANPAALEGLRMTEADLARVSVVDLFPPQRRPLVERALDLAGASALAAGEQPVESFHAALRRGDGTEAPCQVFLEGALLNDAPAVSIYLAFASGEEAERHAGKMEALGRMASAMSHDFNNLLTAINGYAEHLLPLTEREGPVARGLGAIRRAGEAAVDLARSLGEFGRMGAEGESDSAAGAVDVRVDAAVDQLVPALGALLGRGAELRVRPGAGAAVVRLPAGRFEAVVRLLAARARDGMPGGGAVTLATRLLDSAEGEVFTHLAAGPGPHVVIEVGDAGPGLEAGEAERLFEPFAESRAGTRGQGLGLAAVYALAREAGGGLSVSSEAGRGTRVRLYLPAHETPARAAGTPAEEAEPPRAEGGPGAAAPRRPGRTSETIAAMEGHGTILVVEDEPSMREMLSMVLRRFGYTVVEAAAEPEAVKMAASHPETVLVISDITLRTGYGHEMMERLRLMRPGLPAVFVSGHTLDYLSEQGISLPAQAFLEKPFTPTQLALKVREILGRSSRGSVLGPARAAGESGAP